MTVRLRTAALVAACFVFAFTSGCPSERATLEVALRLLPPEVEDRDQGQATWCGVGGELRDAIGCPAQVRLVQTKQSKQAYFVGRKGVDETLFVLKETRPNRATKWKPVDWGILRPKKAILQTSFTPSPDEQVNVRAFALDRVDRTLQTQIIPVRRGMVLQGGMALDEKIPAHLSAPVEFRIRAVSGEDVRVLHSTVIAPGEGESGWRNYSLSLDEFDGQEVALEYTTRFEAQPVGPVVAAPLWSRPLVLQRAEEPSLNFVVVSLDTLRADHVGAYGATEMSTPALDGLAASGVMFETATTTFPSTTASHMSLMTGVYPSVHEVRAPPAALAREVPTLASLLAGDGYRTAAVTENGMIAATAGFRRGFDSYREFKDAMPGDASGYIDKVLDSGIAWLEHHANERFFLFLHTYQVHGPYKPPAEFDRFTVSEEATGLERMQASYRGEVEYADHELQRLLAALEALDLTDRTVVIVTSDHGEGFGEQGVIAHGHDLTEEVMRIPLLIRVPGITRSGSRVSSPASLVDIPPTLLDLAGVPAPAAMQGRSLTKELAGDSGSSAATYAEVSRHGKRSLAIWQGTTKWLFVGDTDRPRVFDASSGKDAPLSPLPEDVVARGLALRDAYDASAKESQAHLDTSGAAHADVDGETTHQLRALGYIE